MKKLLIYGAGAIGRGYLPRVFSKDNFEYYFVERNEQIRDLLNKNLSYTSYVTIGESYDKQIITIKKCFYPGEEIKHLSSFDAVLIAVGPRNFMELSSNFINTNIPIICFENDSFLPKQMQNKTGNKNIFFAIPDVITSNTAPTEFLENDPLSVITEQGDCFIDDQVKFLGGEALYVNKEELDKQWLAKLYIHNTPHCIAAYLGNLQSKIFLHQSMEDCNILKIVNGTMDEIKEMLHRKYNFEYKFLNYYSNKEVSRFSNHLLFDPISRVAREPFRKLAHNERLIGAADLCLSVGVIPNFLVKGIMSAFCFDKQSDQDFHIKFLMNSLTPEEFLRIVIRLRPNEALYNILIKNWNLNLEFIKNIQK